MKYISARFRLSLDINVPLRSEIVAIYFMPATNLESVLEIISQQDETLTFWLFFQRAWSVAGCHLVLLGVESSLFCDLPNKNKSRLCHSFQWKIQRYLRWAGTARMRSQRTFASIVSWLCPPPPRCPSGPVCHPTLHTRLPPRRSDPPSRCRRMSGRRPQGRCRRGCRLPARLRRGR